MKNKRILYVSALLSIAVIIAAAVSIWQAGSSERQPEQVLKASPSPQATPQSGGVTAVPLNTTLSDLPVPADGEVKLSPAQMKEDLDDLSDTLMQVHPRLINGWTAEEQQVIDAAYAKVKEPLTPGEFYFIADTIVVLLHDGHTSLGIPAVKRYLDVPLFWSREGLVVTDKRGLLQPGDIITEIGGRPIGDLETELKQIIPAENDDWVRERGQNLLRTEQFLKHLGLMSENNTVSITAVRGTQKLTEDIELSEDARQKEYNPFPAHPADFTFEIDKAKSLGIFQLNTCVVSDEYKSTVKRFFGEVNSQGITNIAVDLRNNSGGSSGVIDEFLSYINIKQYRTFKSEIRYSVQVKQQQPDSPDHGIVVNEAVTATNVLQTVHPFSGELYVLTSPRTYSSANWFALIVQDNQLGQVIGQASGNQPSSYGDVLSFPLPASGLNFQVSYKKFTRPDPTRDPANAVFPDIEAYTTAQDIMDRRDAQMEKLYEVIGQPQPAAASK